MLCITKVIRSVTVVFLSACESFIQLYRSEPSLQSFQDYREKSLYITESVDSRVFEVQLNSNNVLTKKQTKPNQKQAFKFFTLFSEVGLHANHTKAVQLNVLISKLCRTINFTNGGKLFMERGKYFFSLSLTHTLTFSIFED